MTAPAWFDQAACRGKGPAIWFPEDSSRSAAKAICAICPVTEPCLAYAREHHIMDGIWGGQLPASVRRKELKDKARARRENVVRANLTPRFATPVATHGIRSGYCAGCRCEDCTNANRLYERGRKRQRTSA